MMSYGVVHELLITDNLQLFFMNESACSREHEFKTSKHSHSSRFFNAIATRRNNQVHFVRSMWYCSKEKEMTNDSLVFCGAACNEKFVQKVICFVYDLRTSNMMYVNASKVFDKYIYSF